LPVALPEPAPASAITAPQSFNPLIEMSERHDRWFAEDRGQLNAQDQRLSALEQRNWVLAQQNSMLLSRLMRLEAAAQTGQLPTLSSSQTR